MIKKLIKDRSKYVGYIDGMSGLTVFGWAFNKADPEERVEVVVLVDGEPVAEGMADKFRQDLLDAGIGDGKHAFEITIPEEYADGKEHEVKVVVRRTGKEISHGSKIKVLSRYIAKDLKLNGWCIEGFVEDTIHPMLPVRVKVIEGNKVLGEVETDGTKIFRFFLPKEVLDGKPHIFEIRTSRENYLLGYVIDITPFFVTPYDALEKYSKEPPYKFNPISRFRYEALVNNVYWIINRADLKEKDKEELIREVYKAYEIVNTGWERLREFKELKVPLFEKPKVSIVIPVHNKFELTYNCIASIILATYGVSYEIIVVDDNSKDETVKINEIIKNIKYVRNEENLGFVISCNKGVALAKGDYVLLLNNDTEVLDGWILEMLDVFKRFDKVGFVGAKLLYPDFTLQEAGAIVWSNGTAWNYGRNQNPMDPKFNYVRQVDYCSGACIMLPKQLWDELGGFDVDFAPAYWEETDLAFRVREKGYRVVYTPFAQVIHYEGMTAGKDTQSGLKKYQTINQKKFINKWMSNLKTTLLIKPSFEFADIVKDRNIIGRVLVIDYEIPRPNMEAGGYATFQEIRLFQALGYKVTFAPQNMAYLYGYVEDLQRIGVEVLYAPFYLSVRDIIEKRGKEFDIFYIVRWNVAKDYIDIIKSVNPDAKIILCLADLYFLREIREAIATQNKDFLVKAIHTREQELEVLRKVDLAVSYSNVEEAIILSHNLDSTKVAKWPWVVKPKEVVIPFEKRKDIAFLGNYRHFPNVTAVKFFVNEVMPKLKKVLPDVRFLVYGSNMPDEFKDFENENVVLKGYAKNLEDVFNNCRVFVAPLLSGAGIKGKVIEALSYGVPSVLSPIAVEGTGIRDGKEALIAEKPEEWVEAISKLYKDKDLWYNISQNAIDLVKTEYSFERGVKLVRKALEKIEVFVPPRFEGFYARF